MKGIPLSWWYHQVWGANGGRHTKLIVIRSFSARCVTLSLDRQTRNAEPESTGTDRDVGAGGPGAGDADVLQPQDRAGPLRPRRGGHCGALPNSLSLSLSLGCAPATVL